MYLTRLIFPINASRQWMLTIIIHITSISLLVYIVHTTYNHKSFHSLNANCEQNALNHYVT